MKGGASHHSALTATIAFILANASGLAVADTDKPVPGDTANKTPHSYIVQAATSAEARSDVASVGATASQDLGIFHAVSARLTEQQVADLRKRPAIHVYADRSVASESNGNAGPGKAL